VHGLACISVKIRSEELFTTTKNTETIWKDQDKALVVHISEKILHLIQLLDTTADFMPTLLHAGVSVTI